MSDPDGKLVHRAAQGDRRALARLYERYRDRLLGYLVRQLPDRTQAEDVFQEVWIKVMRGLDSYRPGKASFRAWLFRVAGNAAIDRLRRDDVRKTEELDRPLGDDGSTQIDNLASADPDPERLGLASDLGQRLDGALEQLSTGQRSAILLRHQLGMTYAEIAATLEVAEGTAKTLVHRGLLRLRERMTEYRDA